MNATGDGYHTVSVCALLGGGVRVGGAGWHVHTHEAHVTG